MKKYVCERCGWIYDPDKGFPAYRVKPGTEFDDLPEDFCCPMCYASKRVFSDEDAEW